MAKILSDLTGDVLEAGTNTAEVEELLVLVAILI